MCRDSGTGREEIEEEEGQRGGVGAGHAVCGFGTDWGGYGPGWGRTGIAYEMLDSFSWGEQVGKGQ